MSVKSRSLLKIPTPTPRNPFGRSASQTMPKAGAHQKSRKQERRQEHVDTVNAVKSPSFDWNY